MKKILLVFVAVMLLTYVAEAQDAAAGKDIFTQNCTSCHAVGKQVVGPDLMNVDQVRSEAWIINFVHSSQTVIKSGDTAAVRLFNEFGKTIMPDHYNLKDADIQNIIAYIKDASAKMKDAPKGAGNLPGEPPVYANANGFLHRLIFLDVNGHFEPMTFGAHYFFWIALLAVVVILVCALLLAVKAQSVKDKKEDS